MTTGRALPRGGGLLSAPTRLAPIGPAAGRRRLISAGPLRYLAGVLAVAAGYYACAVGGKALLLTGPAGAFWPAAGFAISVLYLGGDRWWPGVLLGDIASLIDDVLSAELAVPWGTALAQAVGDMTGLLVAALLLRRLAGPRARMDRLRHVGAVVVAVAAGGAISAAVAALSVRTGGLVATSEMATFWRSWWLGDLTGGLVLVPLALAWARPPAWRSANARMGALMIASVVALSAVAVSSDQLLLSLVYPALIWGALAFGPRGATLAVAVAVLIAVWATSKELGPFVEHSPTASALALQLFIAVAALTTLCLAATVSERRQAASELAASRARIAVAAAEERHRIEGVLHDSAQNRIVALIVRLSLARDRFEHTEPEIADALEGFIRDAEGVGDELRRIASGAAPPSLATDGLAEALGAECAASALPVRMAAGEIGRSAPEIETAVYLCCLEAVQNAAKHAGREAGVTIGLRREGGELAFHVHDTGRGFRPRAGTARPVLASARARIEAVGGRVDVLSSPGSGTTVAGRAPWPSRMSAPGAGSSAPGEAPRSPRL